MTCKERLRAALLGKAVDRVPWSPNLAYFWEHQPKELQQKGQLSFMQSIGADPLFRGSHNVCKTIRNNVNIRTEHVGREFYNIYETPIGTLREGYRYSEEGNTAFIIDHPVKTIQELKVLSYIYEHTTVEPDFEPLHQEIDALGENGLHIPLFHEACKTAFQSLLEKWVGTEVLNYLLFDDPNVVKETLTVMQRVSTISAEIAAQSNAIGFIFWEDTSTTNLSPAQFQTFVLPEINQWGDCFHAADKLLIHHACGYIKDLISMMSESHIDFIESMSPPPTGNIEVWDAKKVLGREIGIIGGIEPTVLLYSSLEELEHYVISLIEKMGKERYILANSDSCPPGVDYKKFQLITRCVRNYSS